MKGLPESESKAREEATRREVEEILETEAASQFDGSSGFEELDAEAAAEED